MGSIEQNRRRNQIVAERAGEKARREILTTLWTDEELWHEIETCIAARLSTEQWSGHTSNVVLAVRAQKSVRELRTRGAQLPLI